MIQLTKQQMTIAAAYLCDLAGIEFRLGNTDIGIVLAARAAQTGVDGDVSDFRWSLRIAGLSTDDIDAAIVAISDGKHPPRSLPGMVESLRVECLGYEQCSADPEIQSHWHGCAKATNDVISMLGCKVPK